jgi:hypothetical protein
MPKTDPTIYLEDYAPVAERIALFYARFPTGRIVTELVTHSETQVVFKALVYRSPEESDAAATGWAAERIGDGDINTVACVENTETSAVGRALANLGLTASRSRPSIEELEKAARLRARLGLSRAGAPPHVVREPEAAAYDTSPIQTLANRVTDVLMLIAEAERAGLSAKRVRQLRATVGGAAVDVVTVERAELALRQWLSTHAQRPVAVAGGEPGSAS